jgi:hypothetical protein
MSGEQPIPQVEPPPPQSRWRIFGIRKRISSAGGILAILVLYIFPPLYQTPIAMVRDGIVRFGGEMLKDWLKEKTVGGKPSTPSGIETGSIAKPKDEIKKKLEAECSAQKAKDVAVLIQQRQAAFNAYENCLVEYKQTWTSDPTPRQFCAPKLTEHLKRRQEVIDREAKTCSATASK